MAIKNYLLLQSSSNVDVNPPNSLSQKKKKKGDRKNGREKEIKHGSNFNSEYPLNTLFPRMNILASSFPWDAYFWQLH